MRAALLLYLKVFLLMGIPFGLITGLMHLTRGNGFHWPSTLSSIMFFGGMMSLTLVTMHLIMLRISGIKNITADTIKVSHNRQLASSLSKEELISTLKHHPDFRWRKFRVNGNEIIIHTSSTLWSWGEKVVIRFDEAVGGIWHYTVSSTPPAKIVLVDYGRNLKNIANLERMLVAS